MASSSRFKMTRVSCVCGRLGQSIRSASQSKTPYRRERYVVGANILLKQGRAGIWIRRKMEVWGFQSSKNGLFCMDESNVKTSFLELSRATMYYRYTKSGNICLTCQASHCDSLFPTIQYIVLSIHIVRLFILHCFQSTWLLISKPHFKTLASQDIFSVEDSLLQETLLKISSVTYRMLFRYLLALVIQLCWVSLGFAHEDATIVCLPPTMPPRYSES